jgi:myo-inositol-1-phosphate synthase
MTAPGLYSEHDLFIPSTKRKKRFRYLNGKELITRLGLAFYD